MRRFTIGAKLSVIPVSVLLLCAAASSVAAEETARVDVGGSASGTNLAVVESSANCKVKNRNWGDPATAGQTIYAQAVPKQGAWAEAYFIFTPDKDGEVALRLRAAWADDEKERGKMWVWFDDVSVEGADCPDGGFEAEGSWTMAPENVVKDSPACLSGRSCVQATHDKPVTRILTVREGVPVTVRFNFISGEDARKLPLPGDTPLNLSKAANMGFKDETARDGKGGWSDQGAENDFAGFDTARCYFDAVPFMIVDPEKNGGKAVLTFKSPNLAEGCGLERAVVDINAVKAQWLYLLHTTCWANKVSGYPIGKILLRKTDGGEIALDVQNKRDVADWWMPWDHANASVVCKRKNGKSDVGVYLSKFKLADAPVSVSSVAFQPAGDAIWIVLGATLSTNDYPLSFRQKFVMTADESWRPADMPSKKVLPGSCLDFSSLVADGPSGKFGRVIVNAEGRLAFEGEPDKPVRFFGCSAELTSGPWGWDHASIDECVRLAKLQGYNLFRPHFLDHYLMRKAEKDVEFNPTSLDNFFHLVAQLKENGIYLYLDAMTSWSGYTVGSGYSAKAEAKRFKERIYFDPEVRRNWRAGVEKVLLTVNPYTGTRLVDDPVLAAVLFFNEQELARDCFIGESAVLLDTAWRGWLHEKYGGAAALATAWGRADLGADPFGSLKFNTDHLLKESTEPEAIDATRFSLHCQTELLNWFKRQMSEIGYKGVTTQYDCLTTLETCMARDGAPLISMHTYFDHPTDFTAPGSTISQKSSLEERATYFHRIAATRQTGKPFMITEYGHVYWSQYRFEEGLVVGGYSALQDYDGIMAHALPVELDAQKPMCPFWVNRDPIARASQIIAQLLFLRRDAASSPHMAEIILDKEKVFKEGVAPRRRLGTESELAFVTGFGIGFATPGDGNGSATAKPTAVSLYDGPLAIGDDAPGAGCFDLSAAVGALRSGGVILATNLTNTATGVFHSDTGELLMESGLRRMTARTPRLEAVSMVSPKRISLGTLTVERSSVPACVALASIDGAALGAATRMLLVYATDALNSNSSFGSMERKTLMSLGEPPVLMKAGTLEVSLRIPPVAAMSVWAVAINGERREKLPVEMRDGAFLVRVDTSKLANGPTPFFEIVVE